MEERSFEERVAALLDAVEEASPRDASIGIDHNPAGDGLDKLVEAIDGLLRRSRESLGAFQNARESMRKLGITGDQVPLIDALEENLPDRVYFKDLHSRFLDIGRAHASLFNLKTPTEAIGKTDFDFFTEEHAREAFEDEQRIIRTGEPLINKEEKETWPDRPPTWVLSTKMALRDRHGAIVGTFGISRDITERRRVEEALRKSEERYRLLFNSINDAVLVHGITADGLPGRITEVNDIACERLGYTRDELLRMSPVDFDTPDGAALSPRMIARLKEEKHAVWEGAHVTRSGRRIPVEISNHLIEVEGEPTILATVRDITARRQLEATLEGERTLLLTLIDNLPDYVSVKDAESRILVTNAANARVMGLEDARDAVGKTDLDYYPPSEAAGYREDERRIIRTGKALINKEEQSFDRTGRARWTLTTKVPLRNAQGVVIGVVCAGRDITERRRAEESIKDLARFPDENPSPVMRASPDGFLLYANSASRSLLPSWPADPGNSLPPEHLPELLRAWASGEKREIEVREGENTFELMIVPVLSRGYINVYGRDVTEEKSLAERFLQAQKMEAVGRLAGGIAHDFNNLLTVIGGYCSLAREGLPPESPARAHIEQIARAAKQAGRLTAQLLAFSRKQVLVPRVISPNSLLRDVEKILARLAGEDIELMTFLRPEAGDIKADPGQIEQVLLNLVANARDAMPNGGKLTIETSNRVLDESYAREHPGVKPGEYVRIDVSDTGHGVDRDVLPHIFEPFFTTKDQGKGTGLGLATVYGIVKQSDGAITCYSEPGRGTTFTLYFPRTEEARDTAAAGIGEASELQGTETILLVEDEEMVRNLTRRVLEKSGYTVVWASGGREALAAMESYEGAVALLVTDVVMPKMSGKELAEELSSLRPNMKVLFVSGYTGNAIVHHGMLDPGVDFLQKPFDPRELLGKIRKILNRPPKVPRTAAP
ncbi:MAG: PAS domain-containing protein [Spirochaetia bacterium]